MYVHVVLRKDKHGNVKVFEDVFEEYEHARRTIENLPDSPIPITSKMFSSKDFCYVIFTAHVFES